MYKKTIIILTVVTVIASFLAVGLGVAWAIDSKQKVTQAQEYKTCIDGNYRKSYYDFEYELSATTDSLNKLTVSDDGAMQQKLLIDVANHANKASASACCLVNSQSEGVDGVSFLNKVGDYAASLNYKLARGESLDQNDKDNLTAVYFTLSDFELRIKQGAEQMGDDYSFVENVGADGDIFKRTLDQMNVDVEYPSLIYDGAFSDSLEQRIPQSLKGEQTTAQEAAQMARAYLPFSGELELVAEDSGRIPAFIFQTQREGETYYLTVSKQGALPLSLTSSAQAVESKKSQAECVEIAADFLSQIGLEQMQAVWVSDYNNVYYINFVYQVGEVVVYPDMIKVKVSAEKGEIIGYECLNYIYNHTEREIPEPQITRLQALEKASSISIQTIRLAIVPTDGGEEKLCYEICGERGDDFYYIYVDARSGAQFKIMRVIDTENGKLIM